MKFRNKIFQQCFIKRFFYKEKKEKARRVGGSCKETSRKLKRRRRRSRSPMLEIFSETVSIYYNYNVYYYSCNVYINWIDIKWKSLGLSKWIRFIIGLTLTLSTHYYVYYHSDVFCMFIFFKILQYLNDS